MKAIPGRYFHGSARIRQITSGNAIRAQPIVAAKTIAPTLCQRPLCVDRGPAAFVAVLMHEASAVLRQDLRSAAPKRRMGFQRDRPARSRPHHFGGTPTVVEPCSEGPASLVRTYVQSALFHR